MLHSGACVSNALHLKFVARKNRTVRPDCAQEEWAERSPLRQTTCQTLHTAGGRIHFVFLVNTKIAVRGALETIACRKGLCILKRGLSIQHSVDAGQTLLPYPSDQKGCKHLRVVTKHLHTSMLLSPVGRPLSSTEAF